MDQAYYIGHERQLQHLADQLSVKARAQAAPRLFVVSGPEGSGKRTLMERLWQQLSNGEVPRVMVYLGSEGEDMAQRLIHGSRSNRAYLGAVLAQIAAGVSGQSQRLAEAGRPLPPEARLTLWSDLVEQHLVEDLRNARGLQLIFVLPGLMALPQLDREALLRQLPQAVTSVDTRFIVLSPQRIPPELLRPLFPELAADEVELPALTLDEVELWVQHKGLPHEMSGPIYQRCGGLPGRLDSAAAEVREQMQEQLMLRAAAELLEDMDPTLGRILCLGSLLSELSAETLRVFMPEDEASRAAQAVRGLSLPDCAWQGRSLLIGPQLRPALQKWLERNDPPLYRRSIGPAQEFAQVQAQIPEGAHRQILARLSTFNYFNAELLQEVMGAIAAEVMRFVEGHGSGYFEGSGANLRIRPALRPLVESYIRLVQHKNPEGEAARVQAAWNLRRQQILDLMGKTEDHIKLEGETMGLVQGQIKRLRVEIDAEEDNMQRARRKAMPASPRTQEQRRQGASAGSIVLQAAGTAVLYFSILLSSKVSLAYSALGIGCILAGLFLQGRKLTAAHATAGPMPAPAADLSRFERNLHFLNLKRSQLEARHNQSAALIARDRAQLKEFDKLLREPYC